MKVTLIVFISCVLIASVFGNEDENKDYCPNEKFPNLNPGTCVETCGCTLTVYTESGVYFCAPTGGGTCACTPNASPATACTVTPGGSPSANIGQSVCALVNYRADASYTNTYNELQASDFNIFVADLTSLLIQILAELSSLKNGDEKHGGEKYAIDGQPV